MQDRDAWDWGMHGVGDARDRTCMTLAHKKPLRYKNELFICHPRACMQAPCGAHVGDPI